MPHVDRVLASRPQPFGTRLGLGTAAVVLVACAASGCVVRAAGPAPAPDTPVPDPSLQPPLKPVDREQQEMVRRLRAAVLRTLKADPASARFQGEFISKPEDPRSNVRALCGQVSTRGDAGPAEPLFVAFVANTAGLVAIESSDSSAFQRYVWPAWCSNPL